MACHRCVVDRLNLHSDRRRLDPSHCISELFLTEKIPGRRIDQTASIEGDRHCPTCRRLGNRRDQLRIGESDIELCGAVINARYRHHHRW